MSDCRSSTRLKQFNYNAAKCACRFVVSRKRFEAKATAGLYINDEQNLFQRLSLNACDPPFEAVHPSPLIYDDYKL